jgi:peptidoglycan/xylan/chitin deacetylase (PgdA/CDA1 family)
MRSLDQSYGGSPTTVPILTYHSIDGSGSVISVSPSIFKRQMEKLRDWGFKGITLRHLMDGWQGSKFLPARPVVLTFDDAFGNFEEHAAPLLGSLGFSATLFAVADYCGHQNDWPTQPGGVPRLPLLSWSALDGLSRAGFDVEAHTMSHPALPSLTPADAEREILGSRTAIEERLSRSVEMFAFPYGDSDATSRRIVAAHFRAACGVNLGSARVSSNRFNLPRIDMYYLRDYRAFSLFPYSVGSLYIHVRAAARACRRALTWAQSTSKS